MGIDFGAKLAGTTALAWNTGSEVRIEQVQKGKDADEWLLKRISEIKPQIIILDAPLGLPSAYRGKGEDFFYRECDRQLQAMSPMFLGGLSARAMKLNHTLGGVLIEGYPSAFVRYRMGEPWTESYKQKDQSHFLTQLSGFMPEIRFQTPANNHQTDALICWHIAALYSQKEHMKAGNPTEGIIVY